MRLHEAKRLASDRTAANGRAHAVVRFLDRGDDFGSLALTNVPMFQRVLPVEVVEVFNTQGEDH